MRRQLAAVFAAVAAMITIAFVVPMAFLVRSTAHDRGLDGARADAARLVPIVASGSTAAIAEATASMNASTPRRVSVFEGDVVIGAPAQLTDAVNLALNERASSLGSAEGGSELVTSVTRPDNSVAAIRVFVPSAELNRGVVRAWLVLAGLGAVLIGVAVLVADRIAVSVVRPVKRLADASAQLGSGDLAVRVPIEGPAELQQTAAAFNALADDMGASIERERNTIAELAHRLRTPLTKLRLDVERVDESPALAEVRDDVAGIAAIVSGFIVEARRAADNVRGCDAAHVVADRVTFWQPLAVDEGRRFTAEIAPGTVPVWLAEAELTAALDVLIDNVFTHTEIGTAFALTLATTGADCVITVTDGGPGIPPEMTGTGRSGGGSTGMGLTIATRAAQAAGGSLEVASAPSRVVLRLPLRSPR
jgi:signal transduction histidine kinase